MAEAASWTQIPRARLAFAKWAKLEYQYPFAAQSSTTSCSTATIRASGDFTFNITRSGCRMYGAPALIVDFGTAITFDIVSGKGHYLGGLILPGIAMGLGSLYEKTALLPKVELKRARSIIGKDTVNSMRAGILFGYGAMCDGLIAKYRKILGRGLKVIATGGNAGLIKSYAKYIDIVDSDLTIKSLALVAE